MPVHLKNGLLQRASSAGDELDDMPAEKAGKLFAQIARGETGCQRADYPA